MPINKIFSRFIRLRMKEINLNFSNPISTQSEVFNELFYQLCETQFGLEHGISYFNDQSPEDQFSKIPIRTYDEFKPWIEKARGGELSVVWPGKTYWFAKSSGTTSDRSKHLPVTETSLKTGHYKGGRDLLSIFCDQVPHAPLYSGKHLIIGGSSALHDDGKGAYTGDLSAIIVRNLPPWVEMRRTPSRDITLLEDWNKKVKLMAEKVAEEDVRILAGVPSWMLVVCKEVLNIKGAKTLDEVWPNLWLYMHGGVGFQPYKEEFASLIKSKDMHYLETYNASEGFFALQDDFARDDMALLLNHGVYYEFIPFENFDYNNLSKTTKLKDVEVGKDYAIVISTNAGLWRYLLGDVVRITSDSPYRIKIVGRTSSFINVVGEELMIAQTEQALSSTLSHFNLSLKEFTVAPYFSPSGIPISHQWAIEVQEGIPLCDGFETILDTHLRELNSDYDAKRSDDFVLTMPQVEFVHSGTFEAWLTSKNKLGGQHKIPRLSNTRKIIDEIL
ncbi:MAG: hypothetical protein CMB32_04305 [Euryarchaeota archaeon]|nr:hypothetical protein [Euryarchaeota archaeon]